MAKESRINKKRFIVLESCFILLIIFSLIGTYYFYRKSLVINNNSYNLRTILLEKEKIYSNKKDKLNELNKKIKDYDDIDKAINNIQTEYFLSIKNLEDDILSGKSNRKIAYLTFDDGPYYNTYRVLDILRDKDVKATFFTISMNGEYCYDNRSENCFVMYNEYLKGGHTIANHTYTHAIRGGLYDSEYSFINAIERQEEHIKNQTNGYITNIVRFPGGSSQAKELKNPIIERLREKGYGWVDWSANDGDGKALYSKEQAWNNLYSTVNDNIEVILFHDYNGITTEILPDVIDYLRNNGYELYPLFYESNMINK